MNKVIKILYHCRLVAFTENGILFAICIFLRLIGGFAAATLSIAGASIVLKSKSYEVPTITVCIKILCR